MAHPQNDPRVGSCLTCNGSRFLGRYYNGTRGGVDIKLVHHLFTVVGGEYDSYDRAWFDITPGRRLCLANESRRYYSQSDAMSVYETEMLSFVGRDLRLLRYAPGCPKCIVGPCSNAPPPDRGITVPCNPNGQRMVVHRRLRRMS